MTPSTAATHGDVTEATRAVAMKLFENMEDIQALDALIAPDAEWWVNGLGKLNRANFLAVHNAYTSRPKPISRQRKLLGLTVEGERAAIEMEWEIVWPDVTYHQNYHHVLIIRGGKIVSLREYSNHAAAEKLYGSLDEVARIARR